MSEGHDPGTTTRFVLIAAKRDAAYWTPGTIARELYLNKLFVDPAEGELEAFAKAVLEALVGKSAERFWASDAVTPAKAAAIRSACQALHSLTLEEFTKAAAEVDAEGS